MRKGENQNKEYKQAWNDNCLKTICAFANTGGGKLFIGIDDEGNPMGVKDAARYLDDIPNKTKDILGITPDVTVKKKAGKDIIEVTVAPSSAPAGWNSSSVTSSRAIAPAPGTSNASPSNVTPRTFSMGSP